MVSPERLYQIYQVGVSINGLMTLMQNIEDYGKRGPFLKGDPCVVLAHIANTYTFPINVSVKPYVDIRTSVYNL